MRRRTKKTIFSLIFILALLVTFYVYQYAEPQINNQIGKITGSAVSQSEIVKEQVKPSEIYFASETNLTALMIPFIESAENSLDCALYDMGREVNTALYEKSKNIPVRIVKDDETKLIEGKFKADKYGLMHNKFCIKDGNVVWTCSFNPTKGGEKNDNNVLILYSYSMAEVYSDEFEEMWDGKFKGGDKIKYSDIYLNNELYEVRFCPEDNCADLVVEELLKAKKSIHFMTFSFTHPLIVDLLIAKNKEGVIVEGATEAQRRNMQYEAYPKLIENGISVSLDTNKYLLHHKVFIIYENTVITGSFNPSKNGDENNDENLIVIHSPSIAKLFVEEFGRLSS